MANTLDEMREYQQSIRQALSNLHVARSENETESVRPQLQSAINSLQNASDLMTAIIASMEKEAREAALQ